MILVDSLTDFVYDPWAKEKESDERSDEEEESDEDEPDEESDEEIILRDLIV